MDTQNGSGRVEQTGAVLKRRILTKRNGYYYIMCAEEEPDIIIA